MNANPPETPAQLRAAFRDGTRISQTSGLASGFVQANLAILPQHLADDFKSFCDLNPKPCPLLAVSAPGDPHFPELSADIDIRTDVSMYRVFKDGAFVEEVTDLTDLWRDDLVAFALGCSFSFEEALTDAGLAIRHIELGRNVPMYRTSIDTVTSGPFGGKMVVSMRPFRESDVDQVIAITKRFPRVHGSPVHVGDPHAIGIADINAPDFGDGPEFRDGEVAVFWACGVTPQVAIEMARPEICITHKPGHMLITDRLNVDFMD